MPSNSNTSETAELRRIRSYVLRAGRMTSGQDRAWRELWPRYGIEIGASTLSLDAAFGRTAPLVLEIGFGTGDALLAYAERHPEHDCVGIEVHRPGVGHCMLRAAELGLQNVRVICHDAVEVLASKIPGLSLREIHIFFPDPWHKKRHHKRRLIQTPFADTLARVIATGGVIRLATDWEDYALQMLAVMSAHPSFETFEPTVDGSGFTLRAVHRPLTRFERRGHRLGHRVWDLAFRRRIAL